jgi:DNA-binding NtrC family response regulator
MVGCSKALAEVAKQSLLYRSLKKNILIVGETGTGKELVARSLHTGTTNKYFALNSASFSGNADLLESQLFGHLKDSFTGATRDKKGILEVAHDGTVFFDEIERLSLPAQAKLLRVFQEKTIRPVGESREFSVDFRLIAAAKPHIESMVKDGLFLEDLYHRLKNFTIEIPPLRERIEDIEPLLRLACKKYFEEIGRKKTFQVRTIKKLENYDWPGNNRELLQAAERILYHSPGNTVTPEDLSSEFFGKPKRRVMSWSEFQKKRNEEKASYLTEALKRCKWNVDRTAEGLRMSKDTLHSMVRRMGLKENGTSRNGNGAKSANAIGSTGELGA